MKTPLFTGCATALITPFRNGEVDYPALDKLVESQIASGVNALVAVGGGSVIDTAKGVRLVLSQNADDILAIGGVENLVRGQFIPFVVVPTTSGTGSESTSQRISLLASSRI